MWRSEAPADLKKKHGGKEIENERRNFGKNTQSGKRERRESERESIGATSKAAKCFKKVSMKGPSASED